MNESQRLFSEAQQLMPGGVNSPVRAFGSVGGSPVFFKTGKECFVWDVDNNKYIDYVGSWGTAILGHAHPDVVAKVQESAAKGLSFGAPTVGENEIVKLIKSLVSGIDLLRLVNSGTEACMSALRLARAFTKRDKFVKFSGCYHGHFDAFLVQAGSGVVTLGLPDSPGVTSAVAKDTVCVEYNNVEELLKAFKENQGEIAAIILEPYVGNSGFIRPSRQFIETIANLREEYGCLIIFDEVMTGFRVAKGGAQERLNFQADIVTFGKVIGGGLPIGAYGARKEIMSMIAPLGPVYQAGTLSGNPVAVAAGTETLSQVAKLDYTALDNMSKMLVDGLVDIAKNNKIPLCGDSEGAMFGIFFAESLPQNLFDAKSTNINLFKKFFHKMLENGVYWPPSAFEAGFLSVYHDAKIINNTLEVAQKVFAEL